MKPVLQGVRCIHVCREAGLIIPSKAIPQDPYIPSSRNSSYSSYHYLLMLLTMRAEAVVLEAGDCLFEGICWDDLLDTNLLLLSRE